LSVHVAHRQDVLLHISWWFILVLASSKVVLLLPPLGCNLQGGCRPRWIGTARTELLRDRQRRPSCDANHAMNPGRFNHNWRAAAPGRVSYYSTLFNQIRKKKLLLLEPKQLRVGPFFRWRVVLV